MRLRLGPGTGGTSELQRTKPNGARWATAGEQVDMSPITEQPLLPGDVPGAWEVTRVAVLDATPPSVTHLLSQKARGRAAAH